MAKQNYASQEFASHNLNENSTQCLQQLAFVFGIISSVFNHIESRTDRPVSIFRNSAVNNRAQEQIP